MAYADAPIRESDEVAESLGVDPLIGLSVSEAAARLEQYGPNELVGKPPVPLWRRILDQLNDALVILLLIAAAVSVGAWALEGAQGAPVEAIVVIAVVVFNVVIGIVEESKAADAVAALAHMTQAQSLVLREGQNCEINASDVVPGDILILSEGDQVGADARIVKASSLRVAEAALTGESTPVTKSPEALSGKVAVGDRTNMVFRGTAVTGGAGRAIVTGTGMESEMGNIATMLDETEEEDTPLQKEIDGVSSMLGRVVVAIALIIMIAIAIVQTPETASDWVTILLLGVSLAVAAVPEGLPAILSVVLALGVRRMADRNAVVKKLHSAETLGSASVICTDKTGTLTQNEMTIKEIITGSGHATLSGVGYAPEGQLEAAGGSLDIIDECLVLLEAGALANDAQLKGVDGRWEITGDPTDASFLTAMGKAPGLGEQIERAERLAGVPFSSERKMMSTLHRNAQGDVMILAKGAPDVLLDRCSTVLVTGENVPLEAAQRAAILENVQSLSSQAYRTLGVAVRTEGVPAPEDFDESAEHDLVYLGVVGIIDPPRVEAAEAIEEAHRAGVRVVMITGDHPETARKIAQDLGIVGQDAPVMVGHDIEEATSQELREIARTTSVYARVAPEHKLRIVDALQEDEQIVAMTGDGVNDAPALKSADIGIAMGITGTEVTKDAAKMVLADDNFATIVAAIREGRVIFDNIKKFLRYLLASNMGEVLTLFFGVVLMGVIGLTEAADAAGVHLALPLLATQILWINLVSDTGPALAVGVDPEIDDVMANRPRSLQDKVIGKEMWLTIMTTGFTMAIVSIITMDLWLPGGLIPGGTDDLDTMRTAVFTTIVLCDLFAVLNSRSATLSAFRDIGSNKLLWGSIALAVLLQICVVEIPFLQAAFATESLDLAHWGVALALSSLVLWVEEVRKVMKRSHG
ncbi:MAG: cation-translocating P-type ATPase [Ancrocorticia sp.]|uniref:cation-translocating P-type ATPase n=1 Tax=Ancrocorticia sp. TaxID=2593684 RepID=UPI003F908514